MRKIFRYQQMCVLQDQEWKLPGKSWNSISIFYSVLAVFLACKCQEFRSTSRLGKGIFPENSGLGTRTHTQFQIFRVGVGEFLGKLRSGNRYTIRIFKNPWRTPGYSKKFIQPTEGNCIPGQEKFDHWHPGWGPEQPVHFCISVGLLLFPFVCFYFWRYTSHTQNKSMHW